jgi:hypothetical protein
MIKKEYLKELIDMADKFLKECRERIEGERES